jgi:hypothetical protein
MNHRTEISLGEATGWRTPVNLLILMVAANAIAFSTWSALLNNFAIEAASFTGKEIGILQSIREIPGFLAFTAIFLYFVWREQTFAVLSLALCGLGTAITGFFPTATGFFITTFIMSVGFHYFETVNQSLALQWLPKADAPRQLGRIIAAGSFATIAAYALIFLTWKLLELDFSSVYLAGGGVTVVFALVLPGLPSRNSGKTYPSASNWSCASATGFTTPSPSCPARGVKSSSCLRAS